MLLAIGVGAGLGLSGVLVQGVIRNPLASPDLMGISAGAGLAATACLVLYPNAPGGNVADGRYGGRFACCRLYCCSGLLVEANTCAFGADWRCCHAFLASGIDFLLIVNPIEINTAMVWLTGSLWGRNWQTSAVYLSALLLLLPLAFWLAWRLDVMGLEKKAPLHLARNQDRSKFLR